MTTQIQTSSNLLYGMMLMFFLGACASPQNLLESGNYDQAVSVAVKRLAGKKKKKAKYVQALENAFYRATESDLATAERLKAEGRPENWVRINDIYKGIRQRQERIAPLLPLIDQHGIKAEFRFVRVDGMEQEAKEKAAEHFYNYSRELLVEAQSGDKLAARKAYKELDKIDRYYASYKDKNHLKRLAKELGTSHIHFTMENNAAVILPAGFEQEIERISVRDLNSFWKEYHLDKRPEVDYDYEVIMKITNVNVGPSVVREREYIDTKEIKDGFDYVLDEKGNVKKDTLGNDIKVPRIVEIRARIFESFQTKVVGVNARLEFFDLEKKQLIDSRTLNAETIFEHYASTFSGDKRALSKTSKRRIGNRPIPFPTDVAMIYGTAEQLRPQIKKKLSNSRVI